MYDYRRVNEATVITSKYPLQLIKYLPLDTIYWKEAQGSELKNKNI